MDELDALVTADSDLDFEGRQANEPITTAIIIIGSAFAAGKLVMRVVNEWRGGTVIDTTKEPADIHRDRDLPYGFFTFIAKDGKVTIEAKDEPKDALERMVGEVLALGKPVASAVKDAAEKVLTGKGKVETST
jgi:hypothetical protein